MIRMIQHISASLWLGFWTGMPLVFTTIPRLHDRFSNGSLGILAAGMFMGISMLISLGLTIAGRILIRYRLHKGMTWEQAGIQYRAARQYEKALALYDSFLLFPFLDKTLGETLMHSLTVFSLSHASKTPFFHPQIAAVYLKDHPNDTELARLWLEQFPTKLPAMAAGAMPLQTLSLLAQIHQDHEILAPMILKVFLNLGRTDYSAMQLYSRMLENPDLDQEQREGIYLLVGREPKKFSSTEENLQQMTFDDTPKIRKPSRKTIFRAVVPGAVLMIFSAMFAIICLRPSLPLHFFRPVQKSLVSQGYAIQLGAFLEKKHAEQLLLKVQERQSKPVEIGFVKGGSNTWYVIRIQGFASKKDAQEYGNALAEEGIIKDFFVCIAGKNTE